MKKALTQTSGMRAGNHLIRLQQMGGKRIIVDLDATGLAALQALRRIGYGQTQREVVIRAVAEAAARSSTVEKNQYENQPRTDT